MAQVGNPVGGNLPELRVKNLERDMSVVADAPDVIENRAELEIPFTRQDPVAVAGQLAGGAAQVADLYPGQVVAGKVGQVLELARARCSNGTGRDRRRRDWSRTGRSGPAPCPGWRRIREDFWNSSAIRTPKLPASSAASPSMAAARP